MCVFEGGGGFGGDVLAVLVGFYGRMFDACS